MRERKFIEDEGNEGIGIPYSRASQILETLLDIRSLLSDIKVSLERKTRKVVSIGTEMEMPLSAKEQAVLDSLPINDIP